MSMFLNQRVSRSKFFLMALLKTRLETNTKKQSIGKVMIGPTSTSSTSPFEDVNHIKAVEGVRMY